jgi:AmiR/NasT family two-component response regulator
MREPPNGIVIPLRPDPDRRLDAPSTRNTHLHNTLPARILVEQAKGAVSAHLETTPEVAFELLRGLARSQGRKLTEYAAEVIKNGGRLDG